MPLNVDLINTGALFVDGVEVGGGGYKDLGDSSETSTIDW